METWSENAPWLAADGGDSLEQLLLLVPEKLCMMVQLWYRSGREWVSNEALGQGLWLRKENLQLLFWPEMLKT